MPLIRAVNPALAASGALSDVSKRVNCDPMGIEASYRRITPAEWEHVRNLFSKENALSAHDLEDAYLEFAYSDELMSSERYFSLEKDWHALHVLLTGDVSNLAKIKPFPAPLGNAVMGGTETPIDATYGKVRFLTTSEVHEVADALSSIAVDELASRFDPIEFTKAEVYPNPRPGGWQSENLGPILFRHSQLVKFFNEAKQAGNVVLLSFD